MLHALLLALLFFQSLIEPASLARELKTSHRTILYVGFPALYKGGRITGAVLAGPASKPSGLEALAAATTNLPKNQPIVIYCGCCPWEKCPNIHPAQTWLQEHGFTDVRLLHLPTNFHTDWAQPGYPISQG